MEIAIFAGSVLLAAIVGAIIWWQSHIEDTIFDYQKGLLFRRGRFIHLVEAGTHRLSRKHDFLVKIDLRPVLFSVPGQEILTKDKISIKLTAGGSYVVSDTHKAFMSGISYGAALYADAQSVVRDAIQAHDLEILLGDKTEINASMQAALKTKAATIGMDVNDFSIRDIMLPAGLKKAFGGLLEAQKEAQIAVEKARGEQAVLRNLANSSRLYAEHPTLLSARLVQALDKGAHTLVFNSDVSNPPLTPPNTPKKRV